MSTRSTRPRCTVCRNLLPKGVTPAQGGTCPSCVGQTVLFPKRLAERLSRRSGGGR